MTDAKIAITMNAPTKTKPTIAAGFRRNRAHASDHNPPVGASSWTSLDSSSTSDTSAQPDSRVDERVRDVHDQVDDDEDDGQEQDPALQHRVVAVEDRILEPAP